MSPGFAGGALTAWAIEALLASSILMAFVLLVRQQAQRVLGPQLAYWLWALPALRMAMPPLPASWRESAVAPISAASETMLVLVQPIVAAAPDAVSDPFPWLMVFAAAWVAGALGFFAWHGLAHVSYVRRIVSPPARHEPLPDGTTLVESDEAVGPVAFGVLRRFVAVPSDFAERYDADERKLALAHELGHHARGDLIANWVALAMLAVHWFNPLAWIAYRKFRSDQEMANDARVLSELPPIERHAYACAIVKAAHGRAVTAACHLHTIEDLKGRLRMLKASRKSRRVLMAGATGIAALTVAGLGLTASGSIAAETRAAVSDQLRTYVHTDRVERRRATSAELAAEVRDARAEAGEAARERDEARRDAIADAGESLCHRPGADRMTILRRGSGRTERRIIIHCTPPVPPVPPVRPVAGVSPVPLVPPVPPVPPVVNFSGDDMAVVTTTDRNGKRTVVTHVGPGARHVYTFDTPDVVAGDCGDRGNGPFVVHDRKHGRDRMIVCSVQIEKYARAQARVGIAHARAAVTQALAGIDMSRRAILNNRALSELGRAQALDGLDDARDEMERKLRERDID